MNSELLILQDNKNLLEAETTRLCDFLYDIFTEFEQLVQQIEQDQIEIMSISYLEALIYVKLTKLEVDESLVNKYSQITGWDCSYEDFQIEKKATERALNRNPKFPFVFSSTLEIIGLRNEVAMMSYNIWKETYMLQIGYYIQKKLLTQLQMIALKKIKTSPPPYLTLNNIIKNAECKSVIRKAIEHQIQNQAKWNEGHKKLLFEVMLEKGLFKTNNPINGNPMSKSAVASTLNQEFELGLSQSTIYKSAKDSITTRLKELKGEYESLIDSLYHPDNQ